MFGGVRAEEAAVEEGDVAEGEGEGGALGLGCVEDVKEERLQEGLENVLSVSVVLGHGVGEVIGASIEPSACLDEMQEEESHECQECKLFAIVLGVSADV